MRVISGFLGGRRFEPPAKKWPTRPTTDISKEGLYNILQNRIDFEEIKMLDLFGGTGNHCYEFISRGCTDTTYVDKYGPAHRFVRETTESWGIADKIRLVKMDVGAFIEQSPESFDFIFAGPPYPLKWLPEIPDRIFKSKLIREGTLVIMEHNPDHDFTDHQRFKEVRNYGQTHFSFFS